MNLQTLLAFLAANPILKSALSVAFFMSILSLVWCLLCQYGKSARQQPLDDVDNWPSFLKVTGFTLLLLPLFALSATHFWYALLLIAVANLLLVFLTGLFMPRFGYSIRKWLFAGYFITAPGALLSIVIYLLFFIPAAETDISASPPATTIPAGATPATASDSAAQPPPTAATDTGTTAIPDEMYDLNKFLIYLSLSIATVLSMLLGLIAVYAKNGERYLKINAVLIVIYTIVFPTSALAFQHFFWHLFAFDSLVIILLFRESDIINRVDVNIIYWHAFLSLPLFAISNVVNVIIHNIWF